MPQKRSLIDKPGDMSPRANPPAQDAAPPAWDFLMGGLGLENGLDPQGPPAAAYGGMAASALPIGGLIMKLLKNGKLSPASLKGLMSQLAGGPVEPSADQQVLNNLKLRIQGQGQAGDVGLPAEFMPVGGEEAYNAARKRPVPVQTDQDRIYDMVKPKMGGTAPKADIRALNTGPGDMRNGYAQGEVPAFRSRAGMATDVMDELKNAGQLDRVVGSRSLTNLEGANPIYAASDPAGYVGGLKSLDNTLGFENGALHEGAQRGEPGTVDQLIQRLADYFTRPEMDPFRPKKALPPGYEKYGR